LRNDYASAIATHDRRPPLVTRSASADDRFRGATRRTLTLPGRGIEIPLLDWDVARALDDQVDKQSVSG
jgi:hypothetical protein